MSFFTSSSKKSPPFRRPVMEGGSFYFAYGSNLHLTQMANRCPASIFKGKAVLSGYRWQINDRGVANVVRSPDDSVEGLLYLVNPKDERSLDRSEGVGKGFYQKHLLKVAFEPHRNFETRKSFEVAELIAQLGSVQETTGSISQGLSLSDTLDRMTPETSMDRKTSASNPDYANNNEPSDIKDVKALVYVSEKYTTDGPIREEYVLRMKKAILDAEILGVSRSFVDKYVNPCLEKRNETLSGPNHLRGGGSVAKPHGDGGSMKAKTKRLGEVGGPTPERPQPLVSEVESGALDLVDFQELHYANRERHTDSGLDLPADMLGAIKSACPKATLNEYQMTYVVYANEDKPGSIPRFDILATSWDLELANELAIKHFRDAYSRLFPGIAGGAQVYRAELDGASTRPGPFNWTLDRHACIQLDATAPNSGRIIVRVDAQKLLARK
ncbi:hypothetical protein F5B22DRAFT_450413 [Xylaria bambusicola]|uniref:uncharacterized protein n=1 Tax=Xylaria bambusicola TaxID=326684 RepID=UPI0020079E55|nr:uncharacterized protein F5B22DRAFT_450413 [Xylaria bambusicola]KAI0506348.1 hypothetical protein F5B22DRAFT_450413 [Xylaria bambusicola]